MTPHEIIEAIDTDLSDTEKPTIGQFIRLKRVEAGMSQQQVADALGLSKSAICRRESGDSGWRWVEIEGFCHLLGITLAAFVAGFENQGD